MSTWFSPFHAIRFLFAWRASFVPPAGVSGSVPSVGVPGSVLSAGDARLFVDLYRSIYLVAAPRPVSAYRASFSRRNQSTAPRLCGAPGQALFVSLQSSSHLICSIRSVTL